ncbi:lysine-specific demethylase JMJ706-like protein isoform X1 [Tanacetum coccineum]
MPTKFNRPEASKSASKGIKSCTFGNSSNGFRVTDDMEWINEIKECPVYHPSLEDFEDPLVYIQKIAPTASRYGVCKIVLPLISSTPTGAVMKKEKPGFRFTPKVQPLRLARWTTNDKNTFYISGKSYTLHDFEVMANKVSANKYCLSGCLPSTYIEKEFWFEMTHGKKGTVEYGVNVDGSAFSSSSNDHLGSSKWNLKKLARLPGSALRLVEHSIPGVTDPMMYIGMLFSMFAWHVEDDYLYSINYHHCGAPKTWYGVPGTAAHEFEKVIEHHIYTKEILSTDGANGAFKMLTEKTTMFPPKILLQNHVPVYKVVQLPGDFVVTFPRAYHAGFSHGFNCGEAVNFAARDWFPFGAAANERYTLLRMKPIIPYEEIFCKEAMLLSSKTHKKDDTCDSAAESAQYIKSSFASLIRKYNGAILWLKSLDESLSVLSNLNETITCCICKRDCYVACVSCNCHPDPMCVFHDKEVSACCCGRNHLLSVRADLPKMKDVAIKFEEVSRDNRISRACKRSNKGLAEYDVTKTQQGNATRTRSRKPRTCSRKNNEKVDMATPVNRTRTRDKLEISLKRTRSSVRLKEIKKKRRQKGSQCHLCCSKIAH